MDERAIMGRTWDEINSWISDEEISLYLFRKQADAMDNFLGLIKHEDKSNINGTVQSNDLLINDFIRIIREKNQERGITFNQTSNKYMLFNEFGDRALSSDIALRYLDDIKHTYRKLKTWHQNDYEYNLVGYALASGKDIKAVLEKASEPQLEVFVCDILNKLPDEGVVRELKFTESKDKGKIHQILLALNVFQDGLINRDEINGIMSFTFNRDCKYCRFNFHEYNRNKVGLSLEHIFPQNPKEDVDILIEDYEVISILNTKCEEATSLTPAEKDEITKSLNEKKIKLCLLKKIFAFDDDDLHGIGNLALLRIPENSGLQNDLFHEKRKKILDYIGNGRFVPRHTFDVFSKMLKDVNNKKFSRQFLLWTKDDVEAHEEWLVNKISELKKIKVQG